MDRRSRSIESPRRHRIRRDHRRYSRSRSRSRNQSREHEYRRRSRSPPPMPRSRSRERFFRRSPEQDLYRELIYDDYHHHQDESRMMHHHNMGGGIGRIERIDENDARYMEERFNQERYEEQREKEFRQHRNGGGGGASGPGFADDMDRHFEERHKSREYDRDRDRERFDQGRREHRGHRHTKRYHSPERDDNSDGYDGMGMNHEFDFRHQSPNNTVIVRGLPPHVTEADIGSDLMQCGLCSTSIRLIRKRKSGSNLGASRGFAFVEFRTVDEAVRWMDLKQGVLMLQNHQQAVMHYSYSKEPLNKDKPITDWYCAKCGVFNFKRRDKCFKCCASREESEKGGEGSDEVSNILTKKIMLRNLDVLTNEEGVLTKMQEVVPTLVSKISKILVCRDPLTQTSRGICYLNFDNLVDSMNTHNALNSLEPPLQIDSREVLISYCVDSENRQISRGPSNNVKVTQDAIATVANANPNTYQYTVADVPRLAEYSASLYASTPAEQEHYLKYYTQYYMTEISKGQFGNLPSVNQLGESANSGAAVALSAIQRKQSKMKSIETTATQAAAAAAAAAAATKAAIAAATVVPPRGNDDKQYPTPDVSLYQYDETSGYYYDPSTGLYYDAHSQYYYNNETGAYLYWDQGKSTYVLATAAAAQAAVQNTLKETVPTAPKPPEFDDHKKESKRDKPDKVKVAKKIVKDMEKWAKQLNQKKDMVYVATPQPILPQKTEEPTVKPLASGYADVGFSILEKKDRPKLTEYASPSMSKLVPSYASDSDDHEDHSHHNQQQTQPQMESEKDYVDFQKLTCLLCKRAFQSLDILTKHLKMSKLHMENLQKYNMSRGITDTDEQNALSYRDRAKERRLKYGESDPPPPNRSKERFVKELKHMTKSNKPRQQQQPVLPIGENNVGNRLLQKMGWSEGQGLGRKNQGRTNIIEADARSSTAGLGTKSGGFAPGDDYKSYIKRMMQSRYDSAEIK
ncbi:RNA-binding protein 5-A-like isoform X1 [Episyrphus balteatus]|uniref:RNA-binding protein 5-A-like isoform X1 n=1 Tax=Episyrphus balteatus TaxID=286459 RepID=UPI002486B77F|nr:RNA-binding protein 5-A-like isoform X1 [Episyrphus balteatus]